MERRGLRYWSNLSVKALQEQRRCCKDLFQTAPCRGSLFALIIHALERIMEQRKDGLLWQFGMISYHQDLRSGEVSAAAIRERRSHQAVDII
jgi:hypothetical protein